MSQSRKHLKITSILVLILAGLSLLNIVVELCLGDLNNATIPDGSPENILLITKILLFSVSFLLLLPQFYVGVKGLHVAKKPDASKGHIVWAIILLVLAVLGMLSTCVSIFTQGNVRENVSSLLSTVVDVMVLLDFVKYAKAVAKGN